MFTFSVPTQVHFGVGVRAELPRLLRHDRLQRVGVVADSALRTVPAVMGLIEDLRTATQQLQVCWYEGAEPTYDALEAMRGAVAGRDLQAIIGIGGGSALDVGKGMAVLAQNAAPALEYRGFDKMTAPVLPIIAIPTTAGTGSEVTPNASFVDTRERRKLGINGEAVRPKIAILDPELTLSCPRRPTISAAVDALVHATEAYVAKKTNPMARLFAREGFGRVFNALPAVAATPSDLAARTEVMLGAFLCGVGLMHSGTGPAAAMSYPLGVRYGVAHGYAGGTFLPLVAAYNASNGVHDYADLYDTMNGAGGGESRADRARKFSERLLALFTDLQVFTDPASIGLAGDAVEQFVADTLELQGALDQNPVRFGAGEIRSTLMQLGQLAAA